MHEVSVGQEGNEPTIRELFDHVSAIVAGLHLGGPVVPWWGVWAHFFTFLT